MTRASERFHELHRAGTFVMPNPWDAGSARRFEAIGFPALATTSSGHAASLGRADQEVVLAELLEHVAQLCAAVDVPLNVDLEWGFAPTPDGLGEVVDALAATGAAGFSLEDYDPRLGSVMSIDEATRRISAGAKAADQHDMVLTARAENHLYGRHDLDDTIDRLGRFVEAGAHVVYAPGLTAAADIARVVAIGSPVNVLAFPGAPAVADLADLGVRRISTGGALARVAYLAAESAARDLFESGTYDYLDHI